MTGSAAEGARWHTVAEAVVRQLVEVGVSHVFLNPGTDTAPFQEAVLALTTAGEPAPRLVLCPHETVALAAAQAYHAVTGRPQLVMVHVDVGTQNLGAMLHNAARANAAVVILAGQTPVTANGEQPGGRDSVVHWMQDVPDQAGVVRPYVKSAISLATADTAARQVSRAFQLASSSPAGPVYLTAGRELLMQPAPAGPAGPPAARHAPAEPPAPAPGGLARAAAALASASRPVIVTARAGENPESVGELVALAELLGARVVDLQDRVNFPTDHPCYARSTRQARAAIREADVLLAVACPVPWVPTVNAPAGDATIISMDEDPVRASMPGWSFPVDINLHTETFIGLRMLCEALAVHQPRAGRGWRDRLAALAAAPPAPSASPTQLEPTEAAGQMTAAAVGAALNEVLTQRDIVIEEATTNRELLRTSLERTVPGTFFRSGGSGLGYALGAALGVKLAAPDRRVVAITGDGAFMFGAPTPALWAMKLAQAPALVIVLQNGGYAASRAPVLALFPEGASARSGQVLGTLFGDATAPAPDFALLAQACGGHGAHVGRAEDLAAALKLAVERVDAGQAAVVVVDVTSPWILGGFRTLPTPRR